MAYQPNNPNGQATMANSLPVVIANDQGAIATVENATVIIGQAAQTAAINNILPTTASANATASENFRSASVQVVSTGSGGTFIFEQSNDNVNFIPLPIFNAALTTGVPIVAAITATSSQIIYTFPVRARFARLRIVTTITGGSIQAFSRFSSDPWTPSAYTVSNPTAANLLTTVSGTVTATVGSATIAGGTVAEDAAAGANPIVVGGVVRTATSPITLVAGDAVRNTMTSSGALTQKPFAVPEADWSYAAASGGITNTTDVAIKTAAGASLRNYLTSISIQNASATISTEVAIKDGATVIFRCFVGTQALLNSVVNVTFPSPLKSTANTALNVACITTASAVYVNAQGYVAT